MGSSSWGGGSLEQTKLLLSKLPTLFRKSLHPDLRWLNTLTAASAVGPIHKIRSARARRTEPSSRPTRTPSACAMRIRTSVLPSPRSFTSCERGRRAGGPVRGPRALAKYNIPTLMQRTPRALFDEHRKRNSKILARTNVPRLHVTNKRKRANSRVRFTNVGYLVRGMRILLRHAEALVVAHESHNRVGREL